MSKELNGGNLKLFNELVNASDEISATSDVEYMKDPLSRDIPSVDNSLFILARKLILESR